MSKMESTGVVTAVIATLDKRRILPATIPSIKKSPLVGELIIVEGKKPVGYARDIGWRRAKNPYVCYIDDDEIVPQGWFERLFEEFSDPLVGAVSSTIKALHPNRLNCLELLIENHSLKKHPYNVRFARREALESIGGFDVKAKGGETVYCAISLIKQGWKTVVVDYPLIHDIKSCQNFGFWVNRLVTTGKMCYRDRLRYGEVLISFRKVLFSPLRGFALGLEYRKPLLWFLYPLRCWLSFLGFMAGVFVHA